MTQNSKFKVQLLDKIGAPLVAAIEAVPLQGDDTETEAAKIMAQMLGQAVQVSITLSTSMDITESEDQADSTRLALAALAAPLLAGIYRQNERVPEEQEIKRITKSLEAALAFSENFTPAADHASRLTTIDHNALLFDSTQVSLVVTQALTPAMGAIAEFSFGQPETKLLQDVMDKLKTHAAVMAKQSGASDELSEIILLKSLAQIYADCHRAETARLATASDDNRGELSLAPVWEAFDTRMAMVEIVIGATNTENVSAPASVPQQEDVQQSTSSETPPPTASTSAPAAGPMGFFKPGAKTEAGAENSAPVAPDVASEAPAAPVQQESVAKAPVSPPSSEENTTNSGGPMGFFKPGAKPKDEKDDTAES